MSEFIGVAVGQDGNEHVELVPRPKAAAPSFIEGSRNVELAPREASNKPTGTDHWQRKRPDRRKTHAYRRSTSEAKASTSAKDKAPKDQEEPGEGLAPARGGSVAGAASGSSAGGPTAAAAPGAAGQEAAGSHGAQQEQGVKASDLHRDDRRFIKLQAILTVLPQHLLGWTGSSPDSEGKQGGRLTHADLVEAALVKSCLDYPRYAKELGRLVVAHASQDLAIFVDNEEFRLFTCIRGTNPFIPRDLGDDARVILGLPPSRVADAKSAYRGVCKRFRGYKSYGCGHSLGGSVMHELACVLEKVPEYRFTRVDVFNAGGSPLQRRNSALRHTVFMSHRVTGDLVSYFYDPPGGGTIEHKERPQFGGAHWMGHFLPRRQVVADPAEGGEDLSACLTQ